MNIEQAAINSSAILTVGEIAAVFRQDRETVKRHARQGRLPGFKLGKAWYFRWSDIEDMMKSTISGTRKECN